MTRNSDKEMYIMDIILGVLWLEIYEVVTTAFTRATEKFFWWLPF